MHKWKIIQGEIHDENNGWIATIRNSVQGKRIVQMNNSFDGLLEAAKAVREYFLSVEPDKLTCSEHAIHWVGIDDKCRTTIAKAEE